MIGKKKILGWIPARGGSKGIKDKNIYPLNGKALIAYTIEAAGQSKYIDTVMVSTDSEKIAGLSRSFGAWVPGLRPQELAGDTSKTIDAVLHTLDYLKRNGRAYDIFCLLQPTSPLRTAQDIDGALEKYMQWGGKYSVVGVSEAEDHPVLLRTVNRAGKLERMLKEGSTVRRQDMAKYYKVNGSIYVNAIDAIGPDTSFNDNCLPYIMESSHGIDIDESRDLVLAEYYLNGGR